MATRNLHSAKKSKQDEFYTQMADVEKEMNAYLAYDPDLFAGKTVLLPCDDYRHSNFTRYFTTNFSTLGLKKLISTSRAKDDISQGKLFILSASGPVEKDLDGDGDFRSDEVTAFRDESDFVITNPPFSLFREFSAWLRVDAKLKFAVIGNMNAITYKEIFPLIKSNEL